MSEAANSAALWNPDVGIDYVDGHEGYIDAIIEQYKICTDLADRLSLRRTNTDRYFIVLNTFIAGGLLSQLKSGVSLPGWLWVIAVALILALAANWWTTIGSFVRIVRAKWDVIEILEERLPSRPLVGLEWNVLLKASPSRTRLRRGHWPLFWMARMTIVIFSTLEIATCIALARQGQA